MLNFSEMGMVSPELFLSSTWLENDILRIKLRLLEVVSAAEIGIPRRRRIAFQPINYPRIVRRNVPVKLDFKRRRLMFVNVLIFVRIR
jgi:hypothetical protein